MVDPGMTQTVRSCYNRVKFTHERILTRKNGETFLRGSVIKELKLQYKLGFCVPRVSLFYSEVVRFSTSFANVLFTFTLIFLRLSTRLSLCSCAFIVIFLFNAAVVLRVFAKEQSGMAKRPSSSLFMVCACGC